MFKTGERQNVCTGDPLTPRSTFYAENGTVEYRPVGVNVGVNAHLSTVKHTAVETENPRVSRENLWWAILGLNQ